MCRLWRVRSEWRVDCKGVRRMCRRRESSNSRVGWIDVLDGNTSLDGAQGVPCWLVAFFIPEDGQAAVPVLELHLVLPRHLRLGI